jgi:hypothetical protein
VLEFGQGLIENFFFFVGWTDSVQKIILLQFAKAPEDLRPFFGLEAGEFGKNFRVAHEIILSVNRRTRQVSLDVELPPSGKRHQAKGNCRDLHGRRI